jgi:hypothetical protein
MRKVIFFAMCAFFALTAAAQTKGQNIALNIAVDNLVDPFPQNAKVQVINKLNALLAQNGILSIDPLNRFTITVVAIPQHSEVVGTAPAQVAQAIEFTLYIVDAVEKRIFSTVSFTTKGLGTNTTRCYQDAISHINLNGKAVKDFVDEGRAKIVDWYDTQSQRLFAEAKAAAAIRQYELTFAILTAFPSDSKAYNEAIALVQTYWREYTDYQGQQYLQEAQAIWAATQNKESALAVAQIVNKIEPDAKCRPEVEKLIKEVKSRVREDVDLEFRKYTDEVDLESKRIESARAVGMAFGNGQQPNTTNFVR